jgi:phage/plasmid-like protein (TIGR03299 family)
VAHNLEVQNGQTALALRGTPAWHNLGTVFDANEHVTTKSMLDKALLSNWEVRLEKITYGENYTTVSDNFAVVRTSPFDGSNNVLSVVGSRYKVLQNEELFNFGDNILDGGAQWETAGSLKSGRVVFGTLSMPKSFVLDPSGIADETNMYLIVWTSHDGSVAIQSAVTPVRVVCQNTLNFAMKQATQSFKIRHTQTLQGRLEEARKALDITFNYADEFETMAQELFQTSITNAQFDKLVSTIHPKNDEASPMAQTKYNAKIDTIQGLYHSAKTQDGIRGTKWGALNALSEYQDYFRTSRTGDNDSLMADASGFNVAMNAKKNILLDAVMAL